MQSTHNTRCDLGNWRMRTIVSRPLSGRPSNEKRTGSETMIHVSKRPKRRERRFRSPGDACEPRQGPPTGAAEGRPRNNHEGLCSEVRIPTVTKNKTYLLQPNCSSNRFPVLNVITDSYADGIANGKRPYYGNKKGLCCHGIIGCGTAESIDFASLHNGY